MKKLLEPAGLGKLHLKNRLIRSATSQAMSADLKYDPERLLKVYEDLAKGGAGAIITSFPLVDQDYYTDPDNADHRNRLYEKLTEAIKAEDCIPIAQLVLVNYLNKMSIDVMSPDDIRAVEDMFFHAAERAEKAGYYGVQIHVAHGLFLSRFISPLHNHRTDEFGESQENRSRLPANIITRIKGLFPDLHVSVKINQSDDIPGGLTEAQSLITCMKLEEAGLDSVEVSGNGSSASGIRAGVNESYYKDFALKLADKVSIPVILVGGNRSIDSMEQVLNEGNIEFMSLSRPLIREPDLPKRWMNGDRRPAECVSCNMCYEMPWQECIHNLRRKSR